MIADVYNPIHQEAEAEGSKTTLSTSASRFKNQTNEQKPVCEFVSLIKVMVSKQKFIS